jgi:hypothetical protein
LRKKNVFAPKKMFRREKKDGWTRNGKMKFCWSSDQDPTRLLWRWFQHHEWSWSGKSSAFLVATF